LAERLYDEVWRGDDGKLRPGIAGEILHNFIKFEFMAHPAVPNDAQIGLCAVISDRTVGVVALQGHNSPSFISGFATGDGGAMSTTVSRLGRSETIAVSEKLVLRIDEMGHAGL
jgi:hypothetical protein